MENFIIGEYKVGLAMLVSDQIEFKVHSIIRNRITSL